MKMKEAQESLNAVFRLFLQAISGADCPALQEIATEAVAVDIPGARFVDITSHVQGGAALCEWAETVRRECGNTTFEIHHYFENGCEVMANGIIRIERLPRIFESPCSLHIRFEGGRIAAFQLLLDTYALQNFRGAMD
jgi:ketosteroid isomerase-like protein